MALTEPPAPPELTAEELNEAEDNRRRAIFGLVGAFLAVLVIIVVVQWFTDADDSPDAGDPLPSFDLETIEGEAFTNADITGSPSVINFFASWCAPCLAEMPDFEEVHQANLGEVRFIGVNTRETDVDNALDVVESTGVTYEIVLGDDGSPGSLYAGVSSLGVMPTTAFVDAEGNIVDVHAGVLNAEDLQNRIEELFG